MPRSVPVVVQPDDDDDLEEKQPEPEPAAGAAAALVTGLEDPAISEDALAAVEASRRACFEARAETHTGEGMRDFLVYDDGEFKYEDWLALTHVKREWPKIERALSNAENGTGDRGPRSAGSLTVSSRCSKRSSTRGARSADPVRCCLARHRRRSM